MSKKFGFILLCCFLITLAFCSCSQISTSTVDEPRFEDLVVITSTSTTDSIEEVPNTVDSTSTTEAEQAEIDISLLLLDIFSDLPNLDTKYSDAKLPDTLLDLLDKYGKCTLYLQLNEMPEDSNKNFPDEYILFTGTSDSVKAEFARNVNDALDNPKLFFDGRYFYIKGLSSQGLMLIQCLDTRDVNFCQSEETLSKDYPRIIQKYTNLDFDIIEQANGIFSFNKSDKELFRIEADISADELVIGSTFVDNSGNLMLINTLTPDRNPEFLLIASNVKKNYYGPIYVEQKIGKRKVNFYSNLYELEDGAYFIYGTKFLTSTMSISDKDFSYSYYFLGTSPLNKAFTNVYMFMDKYNRVFIHSTLSFDNQEEQGIDIFVCNVPKEKAELEEIQNLLYSQFSFSEKDEKVNELLQYIN